MRLTELINGTYGKYRKFEDRFDAIHSIGSDLIIDSDEMIELNRSLAKLNRNHDSGILRKAVDDDSRKVSENDYSRAIDRIDEIRYRNINPEYRCSEEENATVERVYSISNARYSRLSDKLESISKAADDIDTFNLNIKDIDKLNYSLYELESNRYLNRKAKEDESVSKAFSDAKEKLRQRISITTGMMYDRSQFRAYESPEDDPAWRKDEERYSIENILERKYSSAMDFVKKRLKKPKAVISKIYKHNKAIFSDMMAIGIGIALGISSDAMMESYNKDKEPEEKVYQMPEPDADKQKKDSYYITV